MSTMSGGPPKVLPYDPDKFVNREREIALVKDKAEALSRGEPVHKRTIVFWGYKGTGRTWLLRHLVKELSDLPGVRAYYLDLETRKEGNAQEAVTDIARRIADQASEWLGRPDSAQVMAQLPHQGWYHQFQEDVASLLMTQVVVLILDHVYESDWTFLDLLEKYILSEAAVKPRVLMVMAGRGQAYPWKTPELRLYTEECHLGPFDEDHTKKQLEKQQPLAVARASEIYKISSGYPRGNYLLAATTTDSDALRLALDELLIGVPPEERSWLEALCVLRSFDEEVLPALLAVYQGDESLRQMSQREVMEKRQRLQATRMIKWQDEQGGWAVDAAVRPILERHLQGRDHDLWRRLHRAACQLYRQWAQDYPEEEARWQREADYHTGCLECVEKSNPS